MVHDLIRLHESRGQRVSYNLGRKPHGNIDMELLPKLESEAAYRPFCDAAVFMSGCPD